MRYVALGKLFDLIILQFSNLWNGEKKTIYILELFWKFTSILLQIVQFDMQVSFIEF